MSTLPQGRTSLEAQGPSRKAVKDQIIERFEQKYIVHPRLVPEMRAFIKPFCIPDPNGKGEFPEYMVTTLQLDTPSMDLALAKERKTLTRFKLRIRTYGTRPEHPVFFELKRKVNNVIIKSRTKMTLGQYYSGPYPGYIVTHPKEAPLLNTPRDNNNFMEYCRMVRTLNARPKMLIRYIRESYFGANDDYARVTFDRRICYRPTRRWELPVEDDGKLWRPMDTQTALNRPFAGYIFELKAMRDAPKWMLEAVERFNLQTTGFCKYATAWRMESLYRGFSYSAQSENTTY
ncbi:MAG TPA: polyphosphate polymerase domain-containing protein [Verrucomicrobiales bacterium]|nr:polyphosphate polymerase domain-containing protein [Verrucomicrobiales bacterium]